MKRSPRVLLLWGLTLSYVHALARYYIRSRWFYYDIHIVYVRKYIYQIIIIIQQYYRQNFRIERKNIIIIDDVNTRGQRLSPTFFFDDDLSSPHCIYTLIHTHICIYFIVMTAAATARARVTLFFFFFT